MSWSCRRFFTLLLRFCRFFFCTAYLFIFFYESSNNLFIINARAPTQTHTRHTLTTRTHRALSFSHQTHIDRIFIHDTITIRINDLRARSHPWRREHYLLLLDLSVLSDDVEEENPRKKIISIWNECDRKAKTPKVINMKE